MDPIEPTHRELMNAVAHELDERFNPGVNPAPGLPASARKVGFFLAVFAMGEPGRFNYISNSDKMDVRTMLADIAARIDARVEAEGGPTLADQRKEIGREIALRKNVYPKWVASGRLKQEDSDRQIGALEAALATLERLVPRE